MDTTIGPMLEKRKWRPKRLCDLPVVMEHYTAGPKVRIRHV